MSKHEDGETFTISGEWETPGEMRTHTITLQPGEWEPVEENGERRVVMRGALDATLAMEERDDAGWATLMGNYQRGEPLEISITYPLFQNTIEPFTP